MAASPSEGAEGEVAKVRVLLIVDVVFEGVSNLIPNAIEERLQTFRLVQR